MNTHVLAIVGPTGVGKSGVAQEVAQQLGGVIISADSMQVYRHMNVGTAKVVASEQKVPHFGLDLVNPDEPYSAAQYQAYAREVIDKQLAASVAPILCGGTGLYVSAALDDLSLDSQGDFDALRTKWTTYLEAHGSARLFEELFTRDPKSANLIHPNNTKRVLRALEMFDLGMPYSEQAGGFKARRNVYPTCTIGLTMERALLYEKINNRVDRMISGGLVEEVARLLEQGFRDAVTASQAIGYKELVEVVEGAKSLNDAAEEIKQATRRYAKRQLTWFRADKRVLWIDTTYKSNEEIVEEIVVEYRRHTTGI